MALLRNVEQQSIQEHEPKDSLGTTVWYGMPGNNPLEDTLLPEWGLHSRDRELRLLYRNQFNWLGQSAVAALTRKFIQTPWQLQGGRNLTTYFQRMLQDGEFGEGWSVLWSKVLLDYLTCDYGAYIEVIGRGKADSELRGRVMGLAHLDSLRCVPTGNIDYPVVYWSRKSGKLHRLHHSRVIRLVDMPDGDELRFGAGLCSMSRAVSIIQQQIPMMRYVAGQMSDIPAAGILFLKDLTSQQYYDANTEYKHRRESLGYKGVMAIGSQTGEPGGDYTPFATAPEGFNYTDYMDIAVNAFAAAFGIDRQDIFPLAGRMAGTATQSEVLYAKAQGMAFGDLLSRVKREINVSVLPAALEFDFEYRDEEKDKQVAERTTILLNNATSLKALGASDETVMRYLAAQDETLRDVLLNENGEIVALPDDDVVTQEQAGAGNEAIETDSGNQTEEDAEIAPGDESDSDEKALAYRFSTGGNADITIDSVTYTTTSTSFVDIDLSGAKDITDTQTAFEARFDDVLAEARAGNINRRRAGILMRGALRTFGSRAYGDGLEGGGVDRSDMSAEDNDAINSLVAQQSPYVSNLTDIIFNGDGISDAQAKQKARLWFNKSINPFFDAGRLSADKNGMYEFLLGQTEEHCRTCSILNAQIHRLKSFLDTGMYPKSSALECGGWECECELVKRPGAKARGNLKRAAATVKAHQHTHRIAA